MKIAVNPLRALLLCASLSSPLIAQTALHEIEPYEVVSANRRELTPRELGSSVTVLTAEMLEKRQFRSVYDALSRVPGVNVRRNGGTGASAAVSLRGLADTQTLILIDGVRFVNAASTSSANLDFIPVGNIERIEVLRGPHSVVYGADAVAGVIHIITKGAVEEDTAFVDVSGGAYDTYRTQFSAGGRREHVYYQLFAQREESDSFSSQSPRSSESDRYDLNQVDLLLGFEGSEYLSLEGRYRYTDSTKAFDGFASPDDTTQLTDETTQQISLRGELELLEGRLKSQPLLSWLEIDTDIPNQSFFIDSEIVNFDWENELQITDQISVVGGYEYEDIEARSQSSFDRTLDSNAFYGLGRFANENGLSVDLGVRNDDNSDFGSETTWRANGSFRFNEDRSRLRASYGTSFKAPSVSQLYNPNFGSTTLKAEQGKGWDVGIEQDVELWNSRLGATFFHNDIDDQIAFDSTLSGPFGGRFNNIDRVKTQGIELSWLAHPHPRVDLDLGFTWTEAEDQSNGLDLARIPEHQFNGDLLWRVPPGERLSLNVGYRFVGDRFNSSNEVNPMGGYGVFDLAADYQYSDRLKLYAKIDNFLDRDYEEIDGFSTPGISAYIGARYQLW